MDTTPYELLNETARIERLIRWFGKVDEDEYMADSITEALLKIGEPAVLPLIAAIENKTDIGWWAIRTLAFLEDERALDPILNVLINSTESNRISWAAFALAELEDERAINIIIDKLSNSKSDVRYYAVQALGKLGIGNNRLLGVLYLMQKTETETRVKFRLDEAIERIELSINHGS